MIAAALAIQEVAPEGFGEQYFHGVTTLHPVGLFAIVVTGIALMFVPRRYAAIPFLVSACFIPASQRLVIATLDFNMLRLLVLAGWARVLMRGEYSDFRRCRLDSFVVAWSLVSATAYILLHGTASGAIYRAGILYDALGLYLFFRCVVRNWSDLETVVRWAAWMSIPIAVIFTVEKFTSRNAFAFLGGVPAQTIVRAGRLRVQGPFSHAILAGAFFAGWLPLVCSLFWKPGRRLLAVLGSTAMVAIVVMCASSTPVGGVLAGAVGIAAWVVRRRMQWVRWGILGTLVGLHMVMKQPVWHLLSRLSFSEGSTAYHRFLLIDNTIKHFSEWALIGTRSTSHWGTWMYDLTNQFVAEAVRGGGFALALFVATLASAFAGVGTLWRARKITPDRRRLAWGLGVSLFAHVVIFFGVSIGHSPQSLMLFFFLLAAIGSLTSSLSVRESVPSRKKLPKRASSRRSNESAARAQGGEA